MLATLLAGWGVIPSWAKKLIMYALVALGAVGGYAAWSVHKVDEGKADQRRTDAALYAKQTADYTARAAAAEKTREEELAALRAYRDAHPVGDVRLCLTPLTVSRPGKADTGGTAAGNVLPVPAPDSGVRPEQGPDVGQLLELLAGKADAVSAQLRADQPK